MSYYLGGVDLVQRAERVPNLKATGGHDGRTAAQYLADLEAEAERSLRHSPRWRAGQPLDDEERWPTITSNELGNRSGIPDLPSKGRWG